MYATVGGGAANNASGQDATVSGGTYNNASGNRTTIPGGTGAAATHYGEMAYAGGGSGADIGEAQTSVYVLRRSSTGSDWRELFLDGSAERLTIAQGRTVTYDIWVVARSNGGESAGYHFWGIIDNVGGTTDFVTDHGGPIGEDDSQWDATVLSDNTNNALAVEVRGNGETIRWVAYVRTVEVAW
jgi:FAD/FMN-containing dehydrogenase